MQQKIRVVESTPKPWFHQYLDPYGTIRGGLFPNMGDKSATLKISGHTHTVSQRSEGPGIEIYIYSTYQQ